MNMDLPEGEEAKALLEMLEAMILSAMGGGYDASLITSLAELLALVRDHSATSGSIGLGGEHVVLIGWLLVTARCSGEAVHGYLKFRRWFELQISLSE